MVGMNQAVDDNVDGARRGVRGVVPTGAGIVARAAAAPITLGMRWVRHGVARPQADIPSAKFSLSLASKIALDDLFFASELVSATFVSLSHRSRLAREISGSLDFFESRGWLTDPSAYHELPPPMGETKVSAVHSAFGFYRHLEWESGYAPHPGEPGRERWLNFQSNRTAHAWLFEHPGEPRPWVVCIPGYRMGHHLIDFTGFKVRWLHGALGMNVAVPVMPLHGPRSQGSRGGDGFLSGDFVDTVHAQSQSVFDTRRLIHLLRSLGAPSIAAYGISLGGYTTALLSSLEKEIDCAIVGVPASDFVALLEGHMPDFAVRLAARIGLPFDSLRDLMRVVSPLAIEPLVPGDRRFIYAATHDGLAIPSQARDLWRHWNQPRIEWYQGSHVSFLWESKVKSLIVEGLSAAGMLDSERWPG